MNDDPDESAVRPGEVAVALPSSTDAGVYFIGTIRTPWRVREECPKRGEPDGPVCSIVVDERWREALTDIARHRRVQVLYWMHHARRDLVLQTPFRTGQTTGTFALRSPVRPNPSLRRWSICWRSREPRCACGGLIAWTAHHLST